MTDSRITPAEIRTLRSHAALVQDRLDRVMQMDTDLRRCEYEWAKKEFTKRWPHYDWKEWAPASDHKERNL